LRTVEKPSFIELVTGLVPSRSVFCRKTLSVRIDTKYANMLSDLKAQLADVRYVCTSADIWSSHNKSYMGVTAHWIGGAFVRKSATLACRRFTGPHTYDRIAEVIAEVHGDFDLPLTKITGTVTDNASNFAKAFKTFAAPDSDDSDDEEDDDDPQFVSVLEIIEQADTDSDMYLPPQLKCAAHTLNLIATTDADKAVANKSYSRILQGSFGSARHYGMQYTEALRLPML